MIEDEDVVVGQIIDEEPEQGQGQELIVLDNRRNKRWQNIDANGKGQKLAAAIAGIERWVKDLEKDYKIRTEELWEDVIRGVIALRDELQKEQNYIFIDTDHTVSMAENLGIIITAYTEVCQYKTEGNLKKRNRILYDLRDLASNARKIEKQIKRADK